ncbi:MAG: CDP-glucose 4,6-dehydratase [Gemmatimonadales bacterium]|nr:CDP-glucose 4,6-dehydratase [Gemmatimonadales bacterium]
MTDPLTDWYRGRRVLVTGHTGFKGSWLVAWLREAGAEVTGFALAPEADRPALFRDAGLHHGIHSVIGDIRDARLIATTCQAAAPEIVFHLAAQSLVLRSYREPVATFTTNVMGTAHVLEAVRSTPSVRAVVVVTSDKCYENDGSGTPLDEHAPMGGHDPYSASKGCTELLATAWRRAFLAEQGVALATARAGNVFGGGDWAPDRLFPDLLGAAGRGETSTVRHPSAVRPWQYVLEPLQGYLLLARALTETGMDAAEGWNFGPAAEDALPVREIAAQLQQSWPAVTVAATNAPPPSPHEAATLVLDATKARERLGWRPVFTLREALAATTAFYRESLRCPDAIDTLLHDALSDYLTHLNTQTSAVAEHRSSP